MKYILFYKKLKSLIPQHILPFTNIKKLKKTNDKRGKIEEACKLKLSFINPATQADT